MAKSLNGADNRQLHHGCHPPMHTTVMLHSHTQLSKGQSSSWNQISFKLLVSSERHPQTKHHKQTKQQRSRQGGPTNTLAMSSRHAVPTQEHTTTHTMPPAGVSVRAHSSPCAACVHGSCSQHCCSTNYRDEIIPTAPRPASNPALPVHTAAALCASPTYHPCKQT